MRPFIPKGVSLFTPPIIIVGVGWCPGRMDAASHGGKHIIADFMLQNAWMAARGPEELGAAAVPRYPPSPLVLIC